MSVQAIGRFEILQELGRGGMSTVYRARDTVLDRPVAIKVLAENVARDEEAVKRFLREAQSAARLKHPNVVAIYEVGTDGGCPHIVMELLEGETLAQLILRSGAMPLDRVLSIVDQLADALDFAHRRGYIHRDIKPSNVMVLQGDRAVLMDFGLAKANYSEELTQFGTIVGTPAYMSPEQIKGELVGPPSDIYSLGLLTYQMLSGAVPFQADSYHSVMHAQVHRAPAPIRSVRRDVPAHVEAAIEQALDKSPDRRPATAGEFVARMRDARPPRRTSTHGPASSARLEQRAKRVPLPVLGALAGVTVLLVVAGVVATMSLGGTSDGARRGASASALVERPTGAAARAGQQTRAAPSAGRPVPAVKDSDPIELDVPDALASASSTAPPTSPPPTPAPVPTQPPTPRVPTATRPATAVPPAPIVLTSPVNGQEVRDLLSFAWQYTVGLAAGETFDVRVCKGDGCNPTVSVTNVRETTYLYCPTTGEGTYRWVVAVIDAANQQVRSGPSAVAQFAYSGGTCGDQAAEGSRQDTGGTDGQSTGGDSAPPTLQPPSIP